MAKEGQFMRAARRALDIVPADEGKKMLEGKPPEAAGERPPSVFRHGKSCAVCRGLSHKFWPAG